MILTFLMFAGLFPRESGFEKSPQSRSFQIRFSLEFDVAM